MKASLEAHVGQVLVLDTDSHWVFIGRLENVLDGAVRLVDADAHHRDDSRTTVERYVMDSGATGVRANRRVIFVNLKSIVAFSPLDQVIQY